MTGAVVDACPAKHLIWKVSPNFLEESLIYMTKDLSDLTFANAQENGRPTRLKVLDSTHKLKKIFWRIICKFRKWLHSKKVWCQENSRESDHFSLYKVLFYFHGFVNYVLIRQSINYIIFISSNFFQSMYVCLS